MTQGPAAPRLRPTPKPSIDQDLFSELTAANLEPVAVAAVPGRATPKSSAAAVPSSNPYANMASDSNVDAPTGDDAAMKVPWTLILLAVLNGFGAIGFGLATLASLGLAMAMPGITDPTGADTEAAAELSQATSGLTGILLLAALGLGLYTLFCLATTVSCFIRHWVCWAIILFAYAFVGGEFLFDIAGVIARGNANWLRIIGRAVFVVSVLAYLHQAEAKRFYRTTKSGKTIASAADILGFICGAAFGAAVFFASQDDSPPRMNQPSANPSSAKNVLGGPLQTCSTNPMTGYYRNGCCQTGGDDVGVHVVCAVMTDDFLRFSKLKGNDLSTPMPMYEFPGLKAGDRWCLCAARWKEAYDAGMAPDVVLDATHVSTLEYATLEELKSHALS